MHGVLKTFLGTTMLLCILRILYFIGLVLSVLGNHYCYTYLSHHLYGTQIISTVSVYIVY